MAIVMATGLPFVIRSANVSLQPSVRDVVEVCSNARAQAILYGKMTDW